MNFLWSGFLLCKDIIDFFFFSVSAVGGFIFIPTHPHPLDILCVPEKPIFASDGWCAACGWTWRVDDQLRTPQTKDSSPWWKCPHKNLGKFCMGNHSEVFFFLISLVHAASATCCQGYSEGNFTACVCLCCSAVKRHNQGQELKSQSNMGA